MTVIPQTVVPAVDGNSVTGPTFGDAIEKVYRRVMAGQREASVALTDDVTADQEAFSITAANVTGLVPGAILAVDYELVYVLSYSQTNSTVSVERAFRGSVAQAHAATTQAIINPKYSRFDIGVAINDDIKSLSSPSNGLGRINNISITYNPVYQAYDLGDVAYNFSEILSINFKTPWPDRRPRPIKNWRVVRNANEGYFPSGQAIVLNEGGYPGMPIELDILSPYIPMVLNTDSFLNTPVTNDPYPPYNGYGTEVYDSNFVAEQTDIPVLGAMIQLTLPREISRNFLESQPDPRKALEVPAGAVSASAAALILQRERRIGEEGDRMRRWYPQRRSW